MKKELLFLFCFSIWGANISISQSNEPIYRVFVWTFYADNGDFSNARNPLAERIENAFEGIMNSAEYSYYFKVLERRYFADLYQFSKTERRLSNKSEEQLKAINANCVLTGSIYNDHWNGTIRIRVSLKSLMTGEIVGSGGGTLTNDVLGDQHKFEQKIYEIFEDEIINKLKSADRSIVISPDELRRNAVSLIAEYSRCKAIIQSRIEYGEPVSSSEQKKCYEKKKEAERLLNILVGRNDSSAILSLIKFYEANNQEDNQPRIRELRKRLRELRKTNFFQKELEKSDYFMEKWKECTKDFELKKKRGEVIYEPELKACYSYLDEGLKILWDLTYKGNYSSFKTLQKFYQREDCPNCQEALDKLNNIKNNSNYIQQD